MKTNKGKLSWLLVGAVWVAAVALYGVMPERMATHWNASGVANGYSGKGMGLFLVPVIMLVIQIMFVAIPKIDPLKNNIEKFRKQFEGFALLLSVFMSYLFAIMVVWNMGWAFSMTMAIIPAFAVMFYGLGALLDGVKRNWFVGIRTPWTMSSDVVWDKTHALGSTLFKIAGALALFGLFVPRYAIGFMIVPILAVTLAVVVYSYLAFKKEQK